MKRTWLLALAVAVALLAIGALVPRYQRAATLRGEALASARRGLAWLRAQEIPFKDPGILWIVSAIDDEYCQDLRLRKFVAERFVEFEKRPHPIYPALRGAALGAREQFFEPFFQRWAKRSNKRDVISAMAYGIYCDRVPLPDDIAETLFATDAAGYELTHQFLALQYMQQRGCLSSPDQKALLPRLARTIAAEQARDSVFSDLSAERVAILLYGDFRSLVETAWIEDLIAQQDATGAWSDPNFPERFYPSAENPHTTALGVWALAEFSRSCPMP